MTAVSIFIAAVTILHILGYIGLVYWTTHIKAGGDAKEGEVIDHTWDGDLKEMNNPMPGWWLSLFYLMIAFAIAYLFLYPGVYEEIEHMVAERAPAREEYLRQVRLQIEEDLRVNKIKGAVTGRPKHYYSIYQKMIVRGKAFDEVYDLVAVRVLVESIKDCYGVLGALHGRWNPIPGRFKDYIAMPKFNLYQSLHTTVIGPGGKPVEIQIRTHEMHRMAESNKAFAHYRW